MKNSLLLLITCFLSQSSFAQWKLNKATFGLTQKQLNDIYNLTDGEIKLNQVYRHSNKSKQNEFYPPPGYFKEVAMDPRLENSWWVNQLNVPSAWKEATGKGITIVDCDAGYYTDEPDIRHNLILDLARDFSDLSNPLDVSDGPYAHHGTAVAAILIGVKDGSGTNGIAFDARMVPHQNYNYDSSDKVNKEEATAACILDGIKVPNVDIIVLENQTRGSSETYEGTREAVKLALKAGITIVSAAGNSSNELTVEEKYDTGSIIVGALRQNNQTASFSNYGSRVSIAAYGEKLYTLYGPNGRFSEFGGTSGATPQVAAAVALMLEVNSNLTPKDVKDILIKTRIESATTKKVGGRLDVASAVKMAKSYQASESQNQQQQNFKNKLLEILK